MDDISILEELGLQEVSRKTHIETKFLKYMVAKQFGKLNRTNTMGFIKILKREYNLDLSSWVEEFESFNKEHSTQSELPSQSPVFAKEEQKKPSKKWLVWLIIVAVIAVAFWKLDGANYISSLKENLANNAISNNTPKVDENPKIEITQEVLSSDETQAEQNTTTEQNSDENVFIVKSDDNGSLEIEVVDENVSKVDTNNLEDNQKADKNETSDIAVLKPKRKIWVGMVDLQKRRKSQYATKKDIDINLTKPQIIVTGHGDFVLKDENGEEKSYSSKDKKYYYVDGGTITQINKKEFITYNGGKSW